MKLFTKAFIFLVGICLVFGAEGQNRQYRVDTLHGNFQRIDSLKKVLPFVGGVDKYEVLFGLAYEYSGEIDSLSLEYATGAYDLALSLGDSLRIIKGGRIKMAQLRKLERLDESIHLAERILPLAKRHKASWETDIILTSLAISHTLRAEYDKALKYNFESLVILENAKDKRQMSICLSNIGLIYYKLEDSKGALDYYARALDLKNELNDKYNLDRLLINMALCYNELGKYSEAKKFVAEGISACLEKCSDQIIVEAEIALGVTLLSEKSYLESSKHLRKSYEISKRIGNFRFQSENLNCMAEVNLALKKYDDALKCLKESQNIAEQKGYRLLAHRVYQLFVELYAQIGDYKNSSLFQTKYIALNDIIYGEKVVNNLVKLVAEHEQRENTRIIAEKDQVLALQTMLLEKQKLQTYLSGSIAALLLILTVVIYWNYREKLSINRRLDQKVKERTEELREVNNDLTKAYQLRESAIRKTWQDTQNIALSIQGLCMAAKLEIADKSAKEYLLRVEDSTDRLISLFSKADN